MPKLLSMDLWGSSAMDGDRNHQRDDGSSKGPNILQASDIRRKGLHGEIQWGISKKGCLHHMGDSTTSKGVSEKGARLGTDVKVWRLEDQGKWVWKTKREK